MTLRYFQKLPLLVMLGICFVPGSRGLQALHPVMTRHKIVLHGVAFDRRSGLVTRDATPLLDEAVRLSQPAQPVLVVVAEDSCRAITPATAAQRAQAVYAYLVDHGVWAVRVRTQTSDSPFSSQCTLAVATAINSPRGSE